MSTSVSGRSSIAASSSTVKPPGSTAARAASARRRAPPAACAAPAGRSGRRASRRRRRARPHRPRRDESVDDECGHELDGEERVAGGRRQRAGQVRPRPTTEPPLDEDIELFVVERAEQRDVRRRRRPRLPSRLNPALGGCGRAVVTTSSPRTAARRAMARMASRLASSAQWTSSARIAIGPAAVRRSTSATAALTASGSARQRASGSTARISERWRRRSVSSAHAARTGTARRCSSSRRQVQQAALADAGLADEVHERAATMCDSIDRVVQDGGLRGSPHQDRPHAHGAYRRVCHPACPARSPATRSDTTLRRYGPAPPASSVRVRKPMADRTGRRCMPSLGSGVLAERPRRVREMGRAARLRADAPPAGGAVPEAHVPIAPDHAADDVTQAVSPTSGRSRRDIRLPPMPRGLLNPTASSKRRWRTGVRHDFWVTWRPAPDLDRGWSGKALCPKLIVPLQIDLAMGVGRYLLNRSLVPRSLRGTIEPTRCRLRGSDGLATVLGIRLNAGGAAACG